MKIEIIVLFDSDHDRTWFWIENYSMKGADLAF